MTKDRENSHGWHGIYLKTTFEFDFFFFFPKIGFYFYTKNSLLVICLYLAFTACNWDNFILLNNEKY